MNPFLQNLINQLDFAFFSLFTLYIYTQLHTIEIIMHPKGKMHGLAQQEAITYLHLQIKTSIIILCSEMDLQPIAFNVWESNKILTPGSGWGATIFKMLVT